MRFNPSDTSPRVFIQSLLAIALFCPLFSMAEVVVAAQPIAASGIQSTDTKDQPEQSDPLPVEVDPPMIDSSRDYLSDKFVGFASGVDAFFGNERNYQESNKSVLQFDLTRIFGSASDHKTVPTFRVKLHLPAFQHRMQSWWSQIHLLFESNPDQNLSGVGPGNTPTASQGRLPILKEMATPDSYGAALRFENPDDSLWRLSGDGGLKFVGIEDVLQVRQITVDPFVRTRGSVKNLWGPVQLQLAQSLFWFNSIGAGESTQFDADYHLSDPLLFRATSIATWLYDNPNFKLHQDFSIYQTLNEHASVLYQLAANGQTQPQGEVSEYVALVLYRQRFYRDWMFFELSPQLHYPKADSYHLNAQFIARLEVLFYK